MFELKPEHTVAKDEVTAAAGALEERLAVLSELNLADEALATAIERSRKRLSAALDPLLQRRRGAGELPDAGQREKAQLGAVGLRVKSLFSEDSEAHVVAASLLEDCDELLAKIAEAEAFAGHDTALDQAMAGLKDATEHVRGRFLDLS